MKIVVAVSFVFVFVIGGSVRGQAILATQSLSASKDVLTVVEPDGMIHYFRTCRAPNGEPGGCNALVPSDASGAVLPAGSPTGWGATDIENAYGISLSGGGGRTVAIIFFDDDPNVETDMNTYRSYYGLPPCTTSNGCFKKLNQNGAATPLPPVNSSSMVEYAIDTQMVSAACPNCNIVLVEANSLGLSDIQAAINTAASWSNYISNSWYYYPAENSGELSWESTFNRPGVNFIFASGDSSYGDPTYPGISAYVTSVGGTVLSTSAGARGWSETVWSSTSSGCSAFISKPAWQTDAGCSMRTATDVSAVATNVNVYESYYVGGWLQASGTSIAAPIVTGIYATTDNTGATPEYSYHAPGYAAFTDVTSGSNGTCSATYPYLCNGEVGYDSPTGNGTPNYTNLLRNNTFFADVTGDHRADGIAVDSSSINVIPSTGSAFGSSTVWAPEAFYGSAATLFGDVNGDGKADGVAFNNGSIYVALSTGSSSSLALWSSGSFWGTYGTQLGDVNGDGKADGVAFDGGAGIWVTLSSGSSFGTPAHWLSTAFSGTRASLVGDVNGDGKADAIAVNANGIVVALSTGSGFSTPATWLSSAFYGSYGTAVGDVNGDGKADLVAFDLGGTYVALSTGTGFTLASWSSSSFAGTVRTTLADVTGDGKADAVAVDVGGIYVMPSSGSAFGTPTLWFSGGFYGNH